MTGCHLLCSHNHQWPPVRPSVGWVGLDHWDGLGCRADIDLAGRGGAGRGGVGWDVNVWGWADMTCSVLLCK